MLMRVTQMPVLFLATHMGYTTYYTRSLLLCTRTLSLVFAASYWARRPLALAGTGSSVVAGSLVRTLVSVQTLRWGGCCSAFSPHTGRYSTSPLSWAPIRCTPRAECTSRDTSSWYCWKWSTSRRIVLPPRLPSPVTFPGCPSGCLEITTSFCWSG